jgi:hypothetical protein
MRVRARGDASVREVARWPLTQFRTVTEVRKGTGTGALRDMQRSTGVAREKGSETQRHLVRRGRDALATSKWIEEQSGTRIRAEIYLELAKGVWTRGYESWEGKVAV